jgi:enoyl-CoA hydratase/carnithine racemase
MGEELLYSVKDRICRITINREARRNAVNLQMILDFLAYLERADHDPEVRVVCITGAGEKAFCSGADLMSTLGGGDEDRMTGPKKYAELLKSLAVFGKPLVARVNGPCLAGGLGIMLSCDIVIARDDAVFFTPEVNVGIFPMMVGALLFRNVGRKKAMEMALTGRKIPAQEAERIGLITRAVPAASLDTEVEKTLEVLRSKSPVGLRMGKDAFNAMEDLPLDEAIDLLCDALGRVVQTEDAAEGMLAFLEKREPDFKGR